MSRTCPRLAAVSTLCVLPLLAGCMGGATMSDGGGLGATSNAIATRAFAAPYDPEMAAVSVAVPEVTISAPNCASIGDLNQAVRSQLVSALASSANFEVVEREALGDIAQEHRLAEAGALNAGSTPTPGAMTGARLLVKVDVTEMQETVLGQSKATRVETGGILSVIGSFIPGVGGDVLRGVGAANPTVGGGTQIVKGLVGMEVRVIDVVSGSIICVTRAQADLTRENTTSVFGIAGISTNDSRFAHSVVAHATRAAIEDAVVKIHAGIRSRALPSVAAR